MLHTNKRKKGHHRKKITSKRTTPKKSHKRTKHSTWDQTRREKGKEATVRTTRRNQQKKETQPLRRKNQDYKIKYQKQNISIFMVTPCTLSGLLENVTRRHIPCGGPKPIAWMLHDRCFRRPPSSRLAHHKVVPLEATATYFCNPRVLAEPIGGGASLRIRVHELFYRCCCRRRGERRGGVKNGKCALHMSYFVIRTLWSKHILSTSY